MKELKMAFAAAAESMAAKHEAQVDAILASSYWSKAISATEAQVANRKALALKVKDALVSVGQKKPLTAEQSSALSGSGLAELDPRTHPGADAIQANGGGGWQVRTYQAATY